MTSNQTKLPIKTEYITHSQPPPGVDIIPLNAVAKTISKPRPDTKNVTTQLTVARNAYAPQAVRHLPTDLVHAAPCATRTDKTNKKGLAKTYTTGNGRTWSITSPENPWDRTCHVRKATKATRGPVLISHPLVQRIWL